jgi:hypothetical protein
MLKAKYNEIKQERTPKKKYSRKEEFNVCKMCLIWKTNPYRAVSLRVFYTISLAICGVAVGIAQVTKISGFYFCSPVPQCSWLSSFKMLKILLGGANWISVVAVSLRLSVGAYRIHLRAESSGWLSTFETL